MSLGLQRWILRGSVLLLRANGAAHLPSIRVLEAVDDLPSAADIARAQERDDRGDDLRDIAGELGHAEPSTVRAFLRAWLEAEGAEIPPRLEAADVGSLDVAAKNRAKRRRSDLLEAAFMVESCGARKAMDGQMHPILPLAWVGRRFPGASSFQDELAKLPPDARAGVRAVTLDNILRSRDTWASPSTAARSIESRGMRPSFMVRVRSDPVRVELARFRPEALEALAAEKEVVLQMLQGREGFKAPETEAEAAASGDHSTVLVVDSKLVAKKTPETEEGSNAAAAARDGDPSTGAIARSARPEALFPEPTARMTQVGLPLSLLDKCVLRGRAFSSERQLAKAVDMLLEAGGPATHALLWRLLRAAFSDVRPYLADPVGAAYLSVPELYGLSLVSLADEDFRLSSETARRVHETARRLQALDGLDAHWTWRGFTKVDLRTLSPLEETGGGGPAEVRDVVRAALVGPVPLSAADADLFRRYATLLDDQAYTARLAPLPPAPQAGAELEAPIEAGMTVGERETLLAAVDTSFSSSIPLLVQASLPFVPKNTVQHSIRALSRLEGRLSSHLNVRVIRQQLVGGDSELFRMEQFLGANDADASKQAKQAKRAKRNAATGDEAAAGGGAIQLKETVAETLKATEHEQVLIRVLQSVQQLGLQRVLDTPSWAWARDALAPSPTTDADQTAPALMGAPTPGPGRRVTRARARARAEAEEAGTGQQGVSQQEGAAAVAHGVPPSPLVKRTAFLQLFGRNRSVKLEDGQVLSVLVAGQDRKAPLLVRVLDDDASSSAKGDAKRVNKFLAPEHDLVARAADALVGTSEEVHVRFPPPQGYRWVWDAPHEAPDRRVRLDIERRRGRLAFRANGIQVPAFDAGALLVACNEPSQAVPMDDTLSRAVTAALYSDSLGGAEDVELLRDLVRLSRRSPPGLSVHDVYDWEDVARRTGVTSHVFRDVLLKFVMRDGEYVSFSASAAANGNTWQSEFASEGTALRVTLALCALYPHCLECAVDGGAGLSPSMRFRVKNINAQYCDMVARLDALAFPQGGQDAEQEEEEEERAVGGGSTAAAAGSSRILTKLWSHQEQTLHKVMDGVRSGQLGFADASSVGAGKTLTALAVVDQVQEHLRRSGGQPRGSLVLLPTTSLINEWVQQVLLHTHSVHVLTQNAQGFLKSAGISNAGAAAHRLPRGAHVRIGPDTLVLTTLARAREHPFSSSGWDIVVIDECLAVQNDALQSSAAWRQVAASSCGVLMLSATFFRSRLSKLYYMLRMLRSPLPRTEAFLPTLLSEHAVVYLPENPRKWKITYRPVRLGEAVEKRYRATFEQTYHAGGDMFGTLKGFLRDNYERGPALEAIAEEVARQQEAGRRPLVFATSREERDLLLERIPNSEGLSTTPDKSKVLVVTVHEGAHGLNLQDRADAIVTRPQPGDLVEQMKGRIDRPSQRKNNLVLVVVVAHNTIEEAEAANIRLCGSYFRAYLDPMSRTFQDRAVAAFLGAAGGGSGGGGSGGGGNDGARARAAEARSLYQGAYQGAVARRFRADLSAQETLEGGRSGGKDYSSLVAGQGTRKRRRAAKEEVAFGAQDGDAAAAAAAAAAAEHAQAVAAGKARAAATKARAAASTKAKNARKPRVKKPPKHEYVGDGPPVVMCEQVVADALQHFSKDAKLAPVVSKVGAPTSLLGKVGGVDPFRALARSIVYQQISTKAGAAIFGRVLKHCDDDLSPARVLGETDEALRSCGLSARKAEYIKCLATFWQEQDMSRAKLEQLNDREILERLLQVKGIGEWSVHMFLMFAMGRPDVLPVGDLVVRKAFKRLYNLGGDEDAEHDTRVATLPEAPEILELSRGLRPYRSVLTWLLWHAMESDTAAYTY